MIQRHIAAALASINFAILRSTLSYLARHFNGDFVNRVKHHLHEIQALVPEITTRQWIRRRNAQFACSSIKDLQAQLSIDGTSARVKEFAVYRAYTNYNVA
jgi:hypothetical protein